MASIPKVSVCIPVFNGGEYIIGALGSVLRQKFQDFEIIIVDNCSTDRSAVMAAELSSKSVKIRTYRNDENIGLAGNLNKCIEYARGDYIKYLCVDDLLLPGCLEQMVSALDAHPEVSLVCGGRVSINESGLGFGLRRYSSRKEIISGFKVINRCLFGGNFIGEPTAVMFRKSDMHAGFRDDLPQLMDLDVWFRLLEHGKLLCIETPLCSVRFHRMQMTLKNLSSGKVIDDNVHIINEYMDKPYIQKTYWNIIRLRLIMTYRIWVSRKVFSRVKRGVLLKQFGIYSLYPVMPIISLVLDVTRKTAVRACAYLKN